MLRQHLAHYKDLKEQAKILKKEMNIKFEDINQPLHFLLQKDKKLEEQNNRKKIGYK